MMTDSNVLWIPLQWELEKKGKTAVGRPEVSKPSSKKRKKRGTAKTQSDLFNHDKKKTYLQMRCLIFPNCNIFPSSVSSKPWC